MVVGDVGIEAGEVGGGWEVGFWGGWVMAAGMEELGMAGSWVTSAEVVGGRERESWWGGGERERVYGGGGERGLNRFN